MKKGTKWQPRFDEKLKQSKISKAMQVRKLGGYELYHLVKYGEAELVSRGMNSSYSYSIAFQHRLLVDEVRWLKTKHVTLLQMQNIHTTPCTLNFLDLEIDGTEIPKTGVKGLL